MLPLLSLNSLHHQPGDCHSNRGLNQAYRAQAVLEHLTDLVMLMNIMNYDSTRGSSNNLKHCGFTDFFKIYFVFHLFIYTPMHISLGGKIGKGTLCVEYSDHGTGDFRSPSFTVIDNCNGSSISPLRYLF